MLVTYVVVSEKAIGYQQDSFTTCRTINFGTRDSAFTSWASQPMQAKLVLTTSIRAPWAHIPHRHLQDSLTPQVKSENASTYV
jgi:hypothetical protein